MKLKSSPNTELFKFCGILQLIFAIAKLTGIVAWSWVWVLSPIWIPIAVGGAFVLLLGTVAALGLLA